jgi:uncharacterized protein YecE (DUF72 family)
MQLSMFEPKRSAIWERAAAVGRQVPANVRFGTSSWSFPGWTGIVWSSRRTEAQLAHDGLVEYSAQPLFRTVGLDRSYYAPVPEADLRRYATQLPPGFRVCAKVPASVASRVGPDGRPNLDFLSPQRLWDDHLGRLREHLGPWLGPVLLEIPKAPPGWDTSRDLARLERCLAGATGVAVELRDRPLLTHDYATMLRAVGATHVYSYWSDMPYPAEQAAHVPPTGDIVIRLLLPPGTTYAERKARLAPFDAVRAPDERLRNEVIDLIGAATRRERQTYVLVNNKAEGSSPLTCLALAERLVGGPATAQIYNS